MTSPRLWFLVFVVASIVNGLLFAVSYPSLRILKTCDELRESLPTAFQTSDAPSHGDAQRDKIRVAQMNIGAEQLRQLELEKPFNDFVKAGEISDWSQRANAMQVAYKEIRGTCDSFERKAGLWEIVRNTLTKFSPK